MRRLPLKLLLLALLASRAFAASVFQLDVCNKHRTVSEAPGTSLTFTKVSSWGGDCSPRCITWYQHPSAARAAAGSSAARSLPSWLHPSPDTPNFRLLSQLSEAQGLL